MLSRIRFKEYKFKREVVKALEILNKLNKAEHWEDYYPSKLQCNEAIEELEKLNSRSCERCKYSFDIFTGIDDSLLGEDFICTKLEVDKVFNKDFYCSEWESKC